MSRPRNRRLKETFQITGTVTTAEKGESLAGMRVMAYVAGTKQQLGSTITDAEGNYWLEFEYDKPVDVSVSVCPDVEETLLQRLPRARSLISKDAWKKGSPYHVKADLSISKALVSIWQTICKTYTIFGLVVKGIPDPDNPGSYLDLIPIPSATVHIFDVSWPRFHLIGETPQHTEYELGTAITDQNGLFTFEFDWCYSTGFPRGRYPTPIWLLWPDYKPDIIFKVTQTVNTVAVPIYAEDPSKTRWNVEQLPPLGVTLIVEDEVILPDDPLSPIAGDFEFHGIGRVLISQMNTDGYANTSGAGDVVEARDSPFGSTIDVKGQFNNSLQGKYYQVLYARWVNDATPPTPTDFTPILNEVWPVAQKIAGDWVTVHKATVELPGTGDGCYEIPDYTDLYLTSKDILIRWRTHRNDLGAPRYPHGKYSLMVKAYNPDGTEISLPAGGDIPLIVSIDNTWPVAAIHEDLSTVNSTIPLCPDPKPPGMICDSPEVCGIIYIEPNKKVRVNFDAYDEQVHFRNYRLTYRTGHGVETNIPGGSKSFLVPSREDYGFTSETIDWDITGLAQCGYEVRLRVWDRTINGYTHIHQSEDFIHIILLEKP